LTFLVVTTAPLFACSSEGSEEGAATAGEVGETKGSFQVFEGEDGQFYFRLVAANGETVLRSEGFVERTNALESIDVVKRLGVDATSFRILRAEDGRSFFRLVAPNNKIVGVSQTYETAAGAEAGRDVVRKLLLGNPSMLEAQRGARFEVFEGANKKFFFRLVAENGEIVLQSARGYATKRGAERAIVRVRVSGRTASRFRFAGVAGGAERSFRIEAASGVVLARGEVYSSDAAAQRGMRTIVRLLGESARPLPGSDLRGGRIACEDLGETFSDVVADPRFTVLVEKTVSVDAIGELSELEKKQIIAANGEGLSIEEAIRTDDDELPSYFLFQRKSDGKRFAAVLFFRGDNPVGAILAADSDKVIATNGDDDLSCVSR